MERYLETAILSEALEHGKMAFVSGPRQVGKTYLGKSLLTSPENYFNWDDPRFRRNWAKDPRSCLENRGPGPVLLDEIHKDRRWKGRLKGVFDTLGVNLQIIVTGSARLDFFRRGGDSLTGRYFPFRLHPLSVGERRTPPPPEAILSQKKPHFPWRDLLILGGFPEVFLSGNENKAKRWSRLRLDRLAAEDIRDLRAIQDIHALRVLLDLLPERVGSLLSINSLREDVGIAYATVRDWVLMLEALYHCFLVRPFAGKLARTLKAEPKLYLYDILQIEETPKRLENLAALHLLKTCHCWTDLAYGAFELRFVRNKEKEEVDFLVLKEKKPWLLLECKSDEKEPSPSLRKFGKLLKTVFNIQLVTQKNYHREFPAFNCHVIDYESFFSSLC